MSLVKKILTNKIFIYLASRYGTYALQFIVSIAIAVRLGPYYLGIFGFVNLIISYFGQINFGVPHSLNVLIVHNKQDDKKCGSYIANSLWLYTLLSCAVFLLYIVVKAFDIKLNEKYPIDNYLLFIALIAILTYMNAILATVLRVRNKVVRLSIVQSISVVLNIAVVFFFKGESLVMALVLCNLLSNILILIICIYSKILPDFRDINLSVTIQTEILYKGLYLFLYNSCFYFIIISIRTIISGNYVVEDFGSFTFSYTISNAVMLLLESLMAIIFPKIIDLLSTNNHEQIERTLENMRVGYISAAHLMIYLAMLCFPIIIYFMPKYENAITSMNLIALAVLMNTNACGYSSLLIAQNKERTSAFISFGALIINIALGLILVYVVHVSFSYVIVATLLTYLYFSFMCVWKGKSLLGKTSIRYALKSFFPIRLLTPYIIALVVCCFKFEYFIWVPLAIYAIFNMQDIKEIKVMISKFVNNPNIADI